LKYASCRILGVDFFNDSFARCYQVIRSGGLLVAPSGPGLAGDLIRCDFYAQALCEADMVLPDSGLMCFWQKWVNGVDITRVSGLHFLQEFLQNFDSYESSFWVMPDENQARANQNWLSDNFNCKIEVQRIYNAPIYDKSGAIVDILLLEKLIKLKPKTIFIQLGGGVQERLGLYIKQNLGYRPLILCTGAALAFLSGEQVNIPKWVDRFYLGWLARCIFKPQIYVPRYLKAFYLIYLLQKYGDQKPKLVN
jgi:N-acetylglucosaminyldiphosphoundecaprenol N-acetyl-beta-D-mannosaminyltransferase